MEHSGLQPVPVMDASNSDGGFTAYTTVLVPLNLSLFSKCVNFLELRKHIKQNRKISHHSKITTISNTVFILSYLKRKLSERWSYRERESSSNCQFSLQMAATSWFGPRKAKNQELHLSLPHNWQGPKYLGHLPPPFPGHQQGTGSEVE